MDISMDAAEILEAVWTLQEQGDASLADVRRMAHTEVTDHLLRQVEQEGLIAVDPAGRVSLTAKGEALAASIIRRHRLAERLMYDVLNADVEETEDAACEFEHLIAEGITNAICTLLGHPRYCPHQRPIPEGPCCQPAREQVSSIVVPCDHLRIGEVGRVAYLSTQDHPRLLKLTALGVTPGVHLRLLQKWPSYVIQCDETEIALEEAIARHIYVWRALDDEPAQLRHQGIE
ncbi:MAG: metal-dependent transcriptional regulator [Acidobacteriota bacterium]|nr:metal-dependent transcriptional regulator [Blastocatellia bacterium]MDW8240132.1 metal-dependent transcriptional regulator [Acidobacteriota bacterium]